MFVIAIVTGALNKMLVEANSTCCMCWRDFRTLRLIWFKSVYLIISIYGDGYRGGGGVAGRKIKKNPKNHFD